MRLAADDKLLDRAAMAQPPTLEHVVGVNQRRKDFHAVSKICQIIVNCGACW